VIGTCTKTIHHHHKARTIIHCFDFLILQDSIKYYNYYLCTPINCNNCNNTFLDWLAVLYTVIPYHHLSIFLLQYIILFGVSLSL
jgi:hypothetical protein